MNKYLIGALVVCLAALAWQWRATKKIKGERDTYKNDTEVLLGDVKKYRTKDSLSAAKVGELELTIDEFKKYIEADAELIKSLEIKNRKLQQWTGTASETVVEIETVVHDTTIIKDSIPVPVKCIDYTDQWAELHACFDDDTFRGSMKMKDSLVIVETAKMKRFLGFLWRTKKIKNKQIDIVSKNPYTTIQDVSVVTIRD